MYTLYHHPFSQHSRRVVALMEAANLKYELHQIELASGEHMSPEYLAINPNHQVPTLIDGNVKIHESNAILRYLCTSNDLETWYPNDVEHRAMVEQWLDWNQCHLGRAVPEIVVNKVFLGDSGDTDAIARGQAVIDDCMPVLEAALETAAYLTGDTVTIADLSVASNIFQLDLAKAAPTTPNITAWYDRVSRLEAYRKSLPVMEAA